MKMGRGTWGGSPVLLGAMLFACGFAALAQTRTVAAEVDNAKKAMDSAAATEPLRCVFSHREPVLNYRLKYETRYQVELPLRQFRGTADHLKVVVRVTPDGHPPVYLTASRNVPAMAAGKADVAFDGGFLVGQGAYGVEAL